MELSRGENDYVGFMQWFQTNHSELYTKCWKAVTMPSENQRIVFDKATLDNECQQSLTKAIQEYYFIGRK